MKYSFKLRHTYEAVFPANMAMEREAAAGSLINSRRGGGDCGAALPLSGKSK
jgi:hypothetical protein